MHLSRLIGLALVALSLNLFGANLTEHLTIKPGKFIAVDSNEISCLSYCRGLNFSPENPRILAQINDSLILTIVNADAQLHSFFLAEYSIDQFIPSGDSITLRILLNQAGLFVFYDSLRSGEYRYLGLAGLLHIQESPKNHSFYWNLRDIQSSYSDAIAQGSGVDWKSYYPDYFTINSKSHPFINQDTNARVHVSLSDTVNIYIVNNGKSVHSLHFHGFHASITQSKINPSHVGRVKDTFPIKPGEVLILSFIADQLGEYPVHDHNLVAVSAGNMYPNGMFTTILVE